MHHTKSIKIFTLFGALLSYALVCKCNAQKVVEIYNELGVVEERYFGNIDSIRTHIGRLKNVRYLVSVSDSNHGDSSLWKKNMTCMFSDPFCQNDSPLVPDSVYEASDLYDGHWISIDNRTSKAQLLWEKHLHHGLFDGLLIVYGEKQLPTYIANFRSGMLDGLKVEYDFESGLYNCSQYDNGTKIRVLSWDLNGTMFVDTVWKPSIPTGIR